MFDRESAIRLGWKQCVVFNHESSPKLYELIPDKLKDVSSYYIVISHPCSLLSYSLEAEPELEFVVAKPIDKIDGNCTHGKNPRKLHLRIDDLGTDIELEQRNRYSISRDQIDKCPPLVTELNTVDARAICRWVINRYVGSAFPDEFETRLSKKRSKLRKIFGSKIGENCRSVYIVMNECIKDLPLKEDYIVNLYFTVSKHDFLEFDSDEDGVSKPYKEFLSTVSNTFAELDGIDLKSVSFLDDTKVTLAQLQSPRFIKWTFDHLSVASNTETDIVL